MQEWKLKITAEHMAVSNTFKYKFRVDSQEGTDRLAEIFAGTVRGGEVFLLSGPIGAGKTYFTRAFAKALGVKKLPVSATFSMMRKYRGAKLNVFHGDLFRAGEEDMENLGMEEFLGGSDCVSIIEWAGAGRFLTDKFNTLNFDFVLAGGDKRDITVSSSAEEAAVLIKEVEKKWQMN